jgi:adenosylhomocysteine nucleosidase
MHCGALSNGFEPTDMSEPTTAKIAIVAALEREVRPLVKSWRVREKESAGRRSKFFEHDDAVLVCAGIGAEAARRAAEAVIAMYAPKIVYSVGFAGALDPNLKIGDIIHPARIVNAGDGSRVEMENGAGVLVSFASIANPEQKARLRDSYAAQAVDMEAAAVARAAEIAGVRFAAVKAISDEVDFEFPSLERFVDSNGEFSELRFAAFAALRPWLWGKVFQIARHSSRASRSLCDALRKIAAGRPENFVATSGTSQQMSDHAHL